MPFVRTALGNYILASEQEANFHDLETLFRSGVVASDFTVQFRRWKVSSRAGRKLSQALVLNEPRTQDGKVAQGRYLFDFTYRNAGENPNPARFSADLEAMVQKGPWSTYAMELLGRPGPSFYMEWQEDGQAEPTGATNWPPSWWPINRYQSDYCYSRWLTVPGATKRVFVPEPCVVKVSGSCIGALNKFRVDCADSANVLTNGLENWLANQREYHIGRFALIVDSNPVLDDEFTNSNPNILDPSTGLMADYCSWQVLDEQPMYLPQRAVVRLASKVALRGGKHYNFRLAFRDALHHGWVDMTGGGFRTFRDDVWEASYQDYPLAPNRAKFETATWALNYAATRGTNYERSFYPSWMNMWEASHLALSFKYGRNEAFAHDSSDNDFSSRGL